MFGHPCQRFFCVSIRRPPQPPSIASNQLRHWRIFLYEKGNPIGKKRLFARDLGLENQKKVLPCPSTCGLYRADWLSNKEFVIHASLQTNIPARYQKPEDDQLFCRFSKPGIFAFLCWTMGNAPAERASSEDFRNASPNNYGH